MIQIQAKFIGKSSLCYITNRRYELRLRYSEYSYFISCKLASTNIWKSHCEYSSYKSFSKNWLVDLSLLDTTTEDIKEPHFDILRINARNFKLNQLIQ